MVFIVGDLHGNWAHLEWTIKHRQLKKCHFIQVGDFGVGYRPSADIELLKELNSFLAEHNCHLWVIRGNHDDPLYFDGKFHYSNLKLMKDYSTEIIEDKKFLFCGGAISIDRHYSLNKMQIAASLGLNQPCYWYDEPFVYDEEKLKQIKDVDIVITHSAPEWCHPQNAGGFNNFVKQFFEDDLNLENELLEERRKLSKFFNALYENGNPMELHFYGHFHDYASTNWLNTTHYLLDIGDAVDLGKYLPDSYTF